MTLNPSGYVVSVALLVALGAASSPVSAQVRRLEELTRTDIQALDRSRTVVLLSGGILEQHGPHLPVYTDGYTTQWFTRRVAEAVVSRTQRPVVIYPQIPLGVGAPEEFAPRQRFSGSYMVRPETMRAVFMDVVSALGEDGFRWIFVIHDHGPLVHNRVLHETADYFMDTYGGTMVVLSALAGGPPPLAIGEEEQHEDGLRVHAGLWETSQMLFLRPELVDSGFHSLVSFPVRNPDELQRRAASPTWLGYFGAPRLGRVDIGGRDLERESEGMVNVALRVLQGESARALPRYGYATPANSAFVALDRAIAEQAARWAEQQARWMKAHEIR